MARVAILERRVKIVHVATAIAALLSALILAAVINSGQGQVIRGQMISSPSDLISSMSWPYSDEMLEGETLTSQDRWPAKIRVIAAFLDNVSHEESQCPGKNPFFIMYGCRDITGTLDVHPGSIEGNCFPIGRAGWEGQCSTASGKFQFVYGPPHHSWDVALGKCKRQGIPLEISSQTNKPGFFPNNQQKAAYCEIGSKKQGGRSVWEILFDGILINPADDGGKYSYTVSIKKENYLQALNLVGPVWAALPTTDIKGQRSAHNGSVEHYWNHFNGVLAQANQLRYQETSASVGFPIAGYTLDTVPISSEYLDTLNRTSPHSGIDFPFSQGTPFLAIASGKVIGFPGGACGNGIQLQLNNGDFVKYCHASSVLTQEGAWVNRGDVLGEVGSTGRSTGHHLHFELRHLLLAHNSNPREILTGAIALSNPA